MSNPLTSNIKGGRGKCPKCGEMVDNVAFHEAHNCREGIMPEIRYAEYTLNEKDDVLKDGHTMFAVDIVKDLNRKSYLEEENKRLSDLLGSAVHHLDYESFQLIHTALLAIISGVVVYIAYTI